jgi:DNA-binding LacI/PurR family transcriptional regulator
MRKTRVGIRDVAERVRVQVATVSDALNHPEQVAPATRARIEQPIGKRVL